MSTHAVLVTGASSGIGHATALLLADRGYKVFAGVRRGSDAEVLHAAHAQIEPLMLDVTKSSDIESAFAVVRESGLPLVGVVNNAGVAVTGPLEFLPLDEIRRQFEINTFAPIAIAQAALPLLRTTRGRIVFIGSIGGRMSAPLVGPYCASKAALASLVDALRQELASTGIAISLFEFAAVNTPIWSKGRAAKDDMSAMLPPLATTYYGNLIDAVVKVSHRQEHQGLDPALIAQHVYAAFTAARPRERYLIGKQAKIQAVVAMLPPRTRDSLIKKEMGL